MKKRKKKKRTNIPRKIDPDEVRELRNQKGEERRSRGSRRKMEEEGETVEMREWRREWSVGRKKRSRLLPLRKTTRCATFVHCVGRVQRCVHMRDTRDAIGHQDGSGLLQTTHRQNNKHGMRHTRPSIHPSLHSFVSISQIPSKIRSPVDTAAGHRRYTTIYPYPLLLSSCDGIIW